MELSIGDLSWLRGWGTVCLGLGFRSRPDPLFRARGEAPHAAPVFKEAKVGGRCRPVIGSCLVSNICRCCQLPGIKHSSALSPVRLFGMCRRAPSLRAPPMAPYQYRPRACPPSGDGLISSNPAVPPRQPTPRRCGCVERPPTPRPPTPRPQTPRPTPTPRPPPSPLHIQRTIRRTHRAAPRR